MRYWIAVLAMAAIVACKGSNRPERPVEVREAGAAPELFLPDGLSSRRDSVLLRNTAHRFDTDDGGQPDTLPQLPANTTLEDIRNGDVLFHGKGGCVNCHGSEATGLAGRGSSLTGGLHLLESGDLRGIDSVIVSGVAEEETRSPIGMPPRGQRSNLTTTETHLLAAYVWALATTRGEPWPGGHPLHAPRDPNASARSAIP
jgi:mono/diheme cytochrome c family protein